jgi:hypothetical protein
VDVALQALAVTTLIIAFVYHRSKEAIFHSLDAFLAKALLALVTTQSVILAGPLILCVWPTALAAAVTYHAGTPRKAGAVRGPYIVWHSLFHVCAGHLALQLVTAGK